MPKESASFFLSTTITLGEKKDQQDEFLIKKHVFSQYFDLFHRKTVFPHTFSDFSE